MVNDGLISDSTLAFGLDVVSLYDSLKFNVVKMALNDAMDSCRPEWDDEFRKFLIDIVISSFTSAVVNFQGSWYGVEGGVPTGGIPSVDVANISVFYVFKKLIYDQQNDSLVHFVRFVDDGLGFYDGDIDNFDIWFEQVRLKSVDQYGLDLTVTVNPVSTFTQFLDIQFKYTDGKLTTDIYRKETDANRYLFFNSHHPRHVFRSVVFSQGMRYRRIINDDDILRKRLDELKVFFVRSGYPERLLNSILDAVPNQPCSLEYSKNDEKQFITPWVVTYGPGYDETKKVEKEVNELLSRSETWKNTSQRKLVQVIPRRAPNLKSLLFKRKALALDPEQVYGTVKCGSENGCQTCSLVSNTVFHNSDIRTVSGTCISWNVVYGFQCKLCKIRYVGKTTDTLRDRVNGHRSKFYQVLKHSGNNITTGEGMGDYDDEQILGAHLVHEHHLTNRTDFNKSYNVSILAHSPPCTLRKTEQFWIDKLNTLRPFGLNQNSSVG